jgi:hypothetical protein
MRDQHHRASLEQLAHRVEQLAPGAGVDAAVGSSRITNGASRKNAHASVDRGEVDIVPEDATGRRPVQPGEQVREGRPSGAVLADQRDDLASVDLTSLVVSRLRSAGQLAL